MYRSRLKKLRSPDDQQKPKKSKAFSSKSGQMTFPGAVKGSMVLEVFSKGDKDSKFPRGKWNDIENAMSSV